MKGRKIKNNKKVLHRCLFYSAPVIMRICFIGLFAWECLIDRIAGGSEFFLAFSFFFSFSRPDIQSHNAQQELKHCVCESVCDYIWFLRLAS